MAAAPTRGTAVAIAKLLLVLLPDADELWLEEWLLLPEPEAAAATAVGTEVVLGFFVSVPV